MKSKLFALTTCFFITLTLNAQKTWIGAGAGGSGTDFNTGSNWSPSGVPTATDNVIIAITSDATITLSANATINNLTFTVNGNNDNARLYVGSNMLTINGNTVIDILNGNVSTDIEIGVNGGTGAGIIDFVGNVSIGATNRGNGAGFAGNINSKLIFRNNLTLGIEAYVNTINRPGTIEFDGTASQNITWNNTLFYCEFNNVVIGNTNSPTVLQSTGTIVPDNILGNLTLNGSSILNLATSQWNGGTSGGGTGNAGALTLNGTSIIRMAAVSGGQSGSNFPSRFSTYSLASGTTVEYKNAGGTSQTIFNNVTYGNLILTNSSGSGTATKNAGGNLVVTGDLIINNNTILDVTTSNFSLTVGGNWTNDGSFTRRSGTVTFNSAVTGRIIAGNLTGTNGFHNLTFNGSGSWSLSNPAEVNNILTLTNGILSTTTANYLLLNSSATASFTTGSSTSFINGPMQKSGTAAFTFPVGATGSGMRVIGISAPSSSSTFTVEFMRLPGPNRSSLGSGITQVSACEHWSLNRTSGSGNTSVILSWNGNSPCNTAAYVTDLPTLRASLYNGIQWTDAGNASTTGNASSGTITSNTVSGFGLWALASSSVGTNPLPIKFTGIRAWAEPEGNKLEWANATESDIENYEIERSADGNSFVAVNTVLPKNNTGGFTEYTILDKVVQNGTVYYRIKGNELNGTFKYSSIVKVIRNSSNEEIIKIYPNPVTSKQFVVQLKSDTKAAYRISVIGSNGQMILEKQWQHPGNGLFSGGIELPAAIKPGLYYIRVMDAEKGLQNTLRLVVQ